MTNRRRFAQAGLGGLLAATGCGLAACSSTSAAQRWYRLPSEPPAGETVARAADASVGGAVWELAAAMPIPELLNRDTLLVEEGAAGIRLLHGHRWAEPLRDTLPQLLRQDLSLFVPGLWTGTATANGPVAGQVRVELLTLLGSLPRRQVALSARWVVASKDAAPRAYRSDELVPWADGAVESLVVAQRLALWRLAQRIAASLQ
jgi:uncharacterized lipoprotein YmbA